MSKPNLEAKRERHRRLYEGQYHSRLGKLWFHTKRRIKAVWSFIKPSKRQFSHFIHPLDHLPAPKRLYTQLSMWSIMLVLVTSINFTSSAYEGGQGVGLSYLDLDEVASNVLVDDEGFIVKSMPLEGVAVYDQNRAENVTHEVQPGESISVIAYRYGLEITSIRYANNLYSDRLRVGQVLTIPPKDGLYVEIEKGKSLTAMVEKYKGDIDATKDFNEINDNTTLIAGEQLFIMDGEPYRPPVVVAASPNPSSYSQTAVNTATATAPTNVQVPAPINGWIRPTRGVITQGYHSRHLAYDVADRSMPPVLAAANGVVVKASSGTWGGGYGNYLIIDHENGYRTLYAHNNVLYVSQGQRVLQGQAIAQMGRTGRVYGVTGIHLHFEISYNGVKKSPSIMGVW